MVKQLLNHSTLSKTNASFDTTKKGKYKDFNFLLRYSIPSKRNMKFSVSDIIETITFTVDNVQTVYKTNKLFHIDNSVITLKRKHEQYDVTIKEYMILLKDVNVQHKMNIDIKFRNHKLDLINFCVESDCT